MIEIAAVLSIIGTLANVGVDIVRYSNNVRGRKMRFRDRLINFFGMSNSMPVSNCPYAVPTIYPQPWIPTQPIGIVGNNPIMDSRRFQNNYELPLWDERNESNMMYGTQYAQRQYSGYVGYPYGNYGYHNDYNPYYQSPFGYQQYNGYNQYGYNNYGYNQYGCNNYGYNNYGQYGYNQYNSYYQSPFGYNQYNEYYTRPVGMYQQMMPQYQYPQYNSYDSYNYAQGNTGYNGIAYPYGDDSNNNNSQNYWVDPTYGMMPGQVSMNPMNVNMNNMNMNMIPTQQTQYDPYMVSPMPQYGQFPTQPVPQQNQYVDYGYNTPRYQNGRINGMNRRRHNRPIEYTPPTKSFWERVREQNLEKMARRNQQNPYQQMANVPPMMNSNPIPMQTTPTQSQSLDSFFEDSAWGMPANFGDCSSFENNPSSAFDTANSIRPNGVSTPAPVQPVTESTPTLSNGIDVEMLEAALRNSRQVPDGPLPELNERPISVDANGRRYYAGFYPDGIPESVYIDKDPSISSVDSVMNASPNMSDGVVSMFADPNGNPLT